MPPTAAAIEKQAEAFCASIRTTNAEYWEVRNKAVLGLLALVSQYEDASPAIVNESLSANFFRLIREPVKDLISDLRSQQVRDVCMFLMKLAEVTRDNMNMKSMLREIFPFVLDGIKVPNRVMSGFVDNAIISMIKHTTFKTCLPSLIAEIKNNKAKLVREHCLEYLNEILIHWEINEKDADMITEAIKFGLEDPAVRAREIARMAYLNMHLHYPKKTDKIKASVSLVLQQRLLKAEQEHISPILKNVYGIVAGTPAVPVAPSTSSLHSSVTTAPTTATAATTATTATTATATATSTASAAAHNTVPPTTGHKHGDQYNAMGNRGIRDSVRLPVHLPPVDDNAITHQPVISPVKVANLRARRQSYEEVAVQSIQAVIRGNLCRRMSTRIMEGRKSFLDHGPNSSHSIYSNHNSPAYHANSKPRASPTGRPPTPTTKSPPKPPTAATHPVTPGVAASVSPFARTSRASSPAVAPTPPAGAVTIPPTIPAPLPAPIPAPTPAPAPVPAVAQSPVYVPSSSSLEMPSPFALANGAASDAAYPSDLHVGQMVHIKGKEVETKGEIRFIGMTGFASGYWVGVALSSGVGKNDGIVLGQQYFTCEPQQGLFVRSCQVDIITPHTAVTTSEPPGSLLIDTLLGLLKVKVASTMEVLHRQLALIELLEQEGPARKDTHHNELIQKLQSYVEEETEISLEFKSRLEAL